MKWSDRNPCLQDRLLLISTILSKKKKEMIKDSIPKGISESVQYAKNIHEKVENLFRNKYFVFVTHYKMIFCYCQNTFFPWINSFMTEAVII